MPNRRKNPWPKRALHLAASGAVTYAAHNSRRIAKHGYRIAKSVGKRVHSAATQLFKRGRASSATKTNHCKPQRVIKSVEGQCSNSYTAFGRARKFKNVKQMTEPCVWINNCPNLVSAGYGQQLVRFLTPYSTNWQPSYSGDHIASLFNNARAFNSSTPLVITTTLSASQASYKLVLKQDTISYMIANASTGTIFLDLYDVMSRHDEAAGGTDPITMWDLGYKTTTAPNYSSSFPAAGNIYEVGAIPTTSYPFNSQFRIIKKTRVEMCPGQTHKHTVNNKGSRILDTDKIQRLISGLGQVNASLLAGLTTFTFAVASGCPVIDTAAGRAVTTGAVELSIVATRRTKVRLLAMNPRITNYRNVLAVEPQPGGSFQQINEETAAIINNIVQ